jgi:hypothetical protein
MTTNMLVFYSSNDTTIFYFHSDAVYFCVNIKNYVIELILATIFHGSMFFTVFMTCIVQEGGGTHK